MRLRTFFSFLPDVSSEHNEIGISLNEIDAHLLPEGLFDLRFEIKLLLRPDDALSQILQTSS